MRCVSHDILWYSPDILSFKVVVVIIHWYNKVSTFNNHKCVCARACLCINVNKYIVFQDFSLFQWERWDPKANKMPLMSWRVSLFCGSLRSVFLHSMET